MESMPSPGSPPCAACKYLRRKCNSDCVYAPYFPPDHPQTQRFVNVHRVFGASNAAKILDKVRPDQRADALVYEADFRIHDPVHGCVGYISLLERKLQQAHIELSNARAELNKFQCGAVLIKEEQ